VIWLTSTVLNKIVIIQYGVADTNEDRKGGARNKDVSIWKVDVKRLAGC
jgi:alanine dehydrogenase